MAINQKKIFVKVNNESVTTQMLQNESTIETFGEPQKIFFNERTGEIVSGGVVYGVTKKYVDDKLDCSYDEATKTLSISTK